MTDTARALANPVDEFEGFQPTDKFAGFAPTPASQDEFREIRRIISSIRLHTGLSSSIRIPIPSITITISCCIVRSGPIGTSIGNTLSVGITQGRRPPIISSNQAGSRLAIIPSGITETLTQKRGGSRRGCGICWTLGSRVCCSWRVVSNPNIYTGCSPVLTSATGVVTIFHGI